MASLRRRSSTNGIASPSPQRSPFRPSPSRWPASSTPSRAAAPALGDDVAIIGCGFMGTLVQLVTALKGPRSITVVDVHDDALERAAERSERPTSSTPRPESPVDIIREATDGRGADVTYEATGANAGLDLAGELARMSGKICIVGYQGGGTRTIPLSHWNWMAFDIVNAHFRRIDTIMAGMRAGMRLVKPECSTCVSW